MRPMPELEVREMAVADLVPYANNAKKHPKEQIDQIAESISEFGNCDPIAVWHNEDGEAEIVEGHGRVMALKQLGIDTAPVICLDHLTDEQRRAYTHVHNQTTLSSGFDEQALIEDMDNLDMDWEALGFSEFMPDFEHDDIEDEGMPEEVVCRCKRGDVWMLGAHRVKCGSSTDPDDMADLLRGGVADLIVTDPPYNVALGQHDRPSEAKKLHRRTDGLVIANDSWDNDEDFIEFLRSAFELGMDVLKPGGAFYIWHADTQRMNFLKACERAGMTIRECLVWVKNVFTLCRQDYQWRHEPCLYGWKDGASHRWYSDRKQSTVLEFDKPSSNSEHPTMKPIPLIAYQIENSSKKGDLVLDMFGGSGSTLIACEKLGRKCVTMELDPHYCDVIISRWEEMTGQRATLEE